MRVALVNTNRIQPPIAPIGLDYVAEALHAAGHSVALLDLCWEDDPPAAIARFFDGADFGLAGLTLRNTDDCGFASRCSFLGEFRAFVAAVRAHTDAPIVAGGVGFSVMPETVLGLCQADAGVWGDGEFTLPEIASRVERRREWRGLPNVVWHDGKAWRRNAPANLPLDGLPSMRRRRVDNPRYFRRGGQAGFETKRGCPGRCTYCADPVAKGRQTRLRSPEAVADEVQALLAQGIDHLHTCDGEFNMPADHALAVCRELARRGLGGKLRWYAYCAPAPFSPELAAAMRNAGCAGINFGADSGDAAMLRRLRRGFTPADIAGAVRRAKEAGMSVMLDLLLGAPGESAGSLVRTVELVKRAGPDRAGVSLGVRVYPGTELAREVMREEHRRGLAGGEDPTAPLFYLEPAVAESAGRILDEQIGGDPRFLFFDPSKPGRNYNYTDNQRLAEAIRNGFRGAYWDILRRAG